MEQISSDVIKGMQQDIHELKNDITAIKDALLGDEYNPGFKQRIEKVEKDTDVNTVQLTRLRNYGAALAGVIGLLGTLFTILAKAGIL